MTTLPSILIASSQTEAWVASSQVSHAAAFGRGLPAAAAAEEPVGRGCLQGAGRDCLLVAAAASAGRSASSRRPRGGRGARPRVSACAERMDEQATTACSSARREGQGRGGRGAAVVAAGRRDLQREHLHRHAPPRIPGGKPATSYHLIYASAAIDVDWGKN